MSDEHSSGAAMGPLDVRKIRVFTTGQVAKLLKVAPHTVSKWFDSGRLKGYRIPGSQDRRIPREYLVKFCNDHGFSTEDFEANPAPESAQ